MDIVGVLVKWDKRHSVEVAVAGAKNAFLNAEHCQGFVAVEVRFNPAQRPKVKDKVTGKEKELKVVDGLQVVIDAEVPVDRVRVCTGAGPDMGELAREIAAAGREVEAAVARATE